MQKCINAKNRRWSNISKINILADGRNVIAVFVVGIKITFVGNNVF